MLVKRGREDGEGGINFRKENITYFNDTLLDLIARSKIRGKPSRLSDSTPGEIGNL